MDASTTSRAPTPASAAGLGGGRSSAPAGRSGSLRRLWSSARESTWAPVAARAGAIVGGMLALAAIGAASTLAGAGVPVVVGAAPSASAVAPGAARGPALPPASSAAAVPLGSASAEPGAAAQAGAGVTADGKVILNSATAEELTKLPRVGAKRAQAIVELRHRLGRFHQPTDLLRVRGIGRKTLKLMLPLLVVDGPGAIVPPH